MENTNLEMIKGLTESGTSLFELVKMQKEYVDLLEKRVEILESVVFKDVRKDEEWYQYGYSTIKKTCRYS